jgi:hypothetical protein
MTRARAGPGPSPRRPGFWAKPAGQTPSLPPRPGQARKSPSPQCKAQAQPKHALFRPAPALVMTKSIWYISCQLTIWELCSFAQQIPALPLILHWFFKGNRLFSNKCIILLDLWFLCSSCATKGNHHSFNNEPHQSDLCQALNYLKATQSRALWSLSFKQCLLENKNKFKKSIKRHRNVFFLNIKSRMLSTVLKA